MSFLLFDFIAKRGSDGRKKTRIAGDCMVGNGLENLLNIDSIIMCTIGNT